MWCMWKELLLQVIQCSASLDKFDPLLVQSHFETNCPSSNDQVEVFWSVRFQIIFEINKINWSNFLEWPLFTLQEKTGWNGNKKPALYKQLNQTIYRLFVCLIQTHPPTVKIEKVFLWVFIFRIEHSIKLFYICIYKYFY